MQAVGCGAAVGPQLGCGISQECGFLSSSSSEVFRQHYGNFRGHGLKLGACRSGASSTAQSLDSTAVLGLKSKGRRRPLQVRSSLQSMVSDMSRKAPKGLFPPDPEPYTGPKLKVAIIGGGLAGMSTAVELLEQGHEVDIYESRSFIGGKVGSYLDKEGNHIEMGLHVFFGCYNNLFRLLTKVGADQNLLVKEHTHTFINDGGNVGELDFRFLTGAPFHGLKAFATTNQLNTYDKLRNALALSTSPVVRALIDPEGAMRDIRELDKISFSEWFISHGGNRSSIQRMWDPIAYALGFLDCDNISARCMLTIFAFFATKTEASLLRMLNGSPDLRLSGPISQYIRDKGGRIHTKWGCREILHDYTYDGIPYVSGFVLTKATEKKIVTADVYVAGNPSEPSMFLAKSFVFPDVWSLGCVLQPSSLDIPGIKKLLPEQWRQYELFDKIYKLVGVPVITVQMRFNGWVTEMQDIENARQLQRAVGLDNLLYSADADFSCFADLALTSPLDYYKPGQGSLMQVVITPGDPYMSLPNEKIVEKMHEQILKLFPSARSLELTWSSVVKIAQSLYREAPGMDVYRPDQKTPIANFFLAGSYTKQDYIDSMEGATLSGRQCSARINDVGAALAELSQRLPKIDVKVEPSSNLEVDFGPTQAELSTV